MRNERKEYNIIMYNSNAVIMKKRYLVPGDYMADPSVHVFEGKVYIYPSHDYESGIPEDD